MTVNKGQVVEHDEIWSRFDDLDFQVRIYRPTDVEGPLPAVLDVHGGAWTTGDRTNGALYNRALAEAGFLVAAIDFRHGPRFQHPAASEDVANAVRWLRQNHMRLGLNPDSIGLLGSSSGGHLALLAGIVPDRYRNAQSSAIAATVSYIIALWPVSDPWYRYRYARRAHIERLVAAHETYYGTESAMREASVPRLVTAGEAEVLPPTLIVQPGEDGNVPIEMTFDLLRAWQGRNGYIEYAHFPEQPHAFGHRPSDATTTLVKVLIAFARRYCS